MAGWARRCVLGGLIGMVLSLATPVLATPTTGDLIRILRLEEMARLMQAEGLTYAADLENDLLPGGGGGYWDTQIARIYDIDRMMQLVSGALDQKLTGADRAAVVAFFDTEQGQEILTYEIAARAAMADQDVEDVARQIYAEKAATPDPRLTAITRFVEVNDLMERNVAGALSSNYHFYSGLVDGGAYEMSEDDILADVWEQEDDIREETEGWLFGYLLMAYQPLGDDVLDAYVTFSQSDEGKVLNAALFDAFDTMYNDISYALGRAAAQAMSGSDL
jgi:hypothetical protein